MLSQRRPTLVLFDRASSTREESESVMNTKSTKSAVPTADEIAAMDPKQRRKLMLDESAAKRAALQKSEPVPAMPVTDWMTRADASQRSNGGTSKRKSSSKRVERTVTFSVNGHDEGERHQRLSTLAARAKISVVELRALLAKQGVTEPDTTAWTIDVNGKTLAARPIGTPAPKPAAKPAAKATTAKKATAAKKRAAKKSTLPGPMGRNVSKKATTRKSAATARKAS